LTLEDRSEARRGEWVIALARNLHSGRMRGLRNRVLRILLVVAGWMSPACCPDESGKQAAETSSVTGGGGGGGGGRSDGGGGQGGTPSAACHSVKELRDPGLVDSSIEGLDDDATGSCFEFAVQAEIAGDAEFEIEAAASGVMRVHLSPFSCTGIDWGLHARTTCDEASTELACDSDPDPCSDEALSIEVSVGDRVTVIVSVASAFDGDLSEALADPAALEFRLDVETHPAGAEVCSDGTDNDADGRVDCEDREDCSLDSECPLAEACGEALPLGPIVSGNTQGGTRYFRSVCVGIVGGEGGAPERIYSYEAQSDGVLFIFSVGELFHEVLTSQEGCPDSNRDRAEQCTACSADAYGPCGLWLREVLVAGDRRFIFVDGTDPFEFGNYQLISTFLEATETEPNDAAAIATPYVDGFLGTLRGPDSIDYISLSVPGPASKLSAAIGDLGTGECGQGIGGSLFPSLDLVAPDASGVLAHDEGDGRSCATLDIEGLAAGTYYLKVTAQDAYVPIGYGVSAVVE
jgi:hypothetical protein